jgi:hypothetical protein
MDDFTTGLRNRIHGLLTCFAVPGG